MAVSDYACHNGSVPHFDNLEKKSFNEMVSLQFITHLGNFSLIEKEYPWGSNFQEDRMNIWQVLLLSQL